MRAVQTQSNRFQNYTMANGNTRSSGSTFSSGAWQPSTIWGNPVSNYGRRDAATPRGKSPNRARGRDGYHGRGHLTRTTGSDEASPAVPSGSSALAASSEAEPWGGRNGGPWNTSETPARHENSGSGSPNRPQTAGQTIHELSFRTTLPTIGQAGNLGRTAAGQPLQGFGGHYATGLDSGVDKRDSTGSIGSLQYGVDSGVRGFSSERRPGLPEGFPEQVNGPSREVDADHAQPQGMFGSNGISRGPFNGQTQSSGHSHRPSMPSSASYPSQAANQRAFNINTQLDEDRFARALSLEDNPEPARNAGYASMSQAFQFNPGSQPWEASPANGARSSTGGYPQDGYGESLPAPYQSLSNRSSVADRVPTPAGSYRQMNSPRGFGTPPAKGTSWSRPTSRDPRSEADRRGPGQAFSNHSHNFLGYYNQAYIPSEYPSPAMYDPYAHLALRGMPVSAFPAMGAYGPGVAPAGGRQPSRDQSVEGVRSVVLDDFRNSNRSNRRYELKVRLRATRGRDGGGKLTSLS